MEPYFSLDMRLGGGNKVIPTAWNGSELCRTWSDLRLGWEATRETATHAHDPCEWDRHEALRANIEKLIGLH